MIEVTNYKHIFKPFKIGNISVKNRIEMAPVGPLLAVGGLASRELIEWGRALARGGVSIVTLGDSSIKLPPGMQSSNALNLGTDRAINPLSMYAEAIQRYGARASIQLNYHTENSPTDMPLEEIKEIIEDFAAAAYRCLCAGMDMIMIHGAHGQLISRFVSPRINHRTDAYGGTPGNRARLAIEILEAIRNKVGDRLAIEYRISADEFVPGGLKVEEQLEFAGMIQDKVDLIHVSAGHLFTTDTLPRMIQPAYLPRGINVDFAAMFKQELKTPVAAVGSLNLEMAEEIIAGNKADMVAMGRTLIADPDCINKARQGKEKEIRPCVRCNTCIDRTHNQRLPIRCAVNPLCGREAEFMNLPGADAGKKVVIIGGGPAGMEAARRAAGRGHEVVLFEKNACLGGTLTSAAAAPFKTDMKRYLDWAIRSTMNAPHLIVRTSTEATPERVRAENPDKLIIAAGSEPVVPDIPGIDRENVFWAGDVAAGLRSVGGRVVVAGAGLAGSETALLLAQQGKIVTLIDMLTLEEVDADYPYISVVALRTMLRELGVELKTEVEFERITGEGIVIIDKKRKSIEIPCDTLVLALGLELCAEVVEKFSGLAPEVSIIGDCNNQSGNLYSAVSEGFFAAMDI